MQMCCNQNQKKELHRAIFFRKNLDCIKTIRLNGSLVDGHFLKSRFAAFALELVSLRKINKITIICQFIEQSLTFIKNGIVLKFNLQIIY